MYLTYMIQISTYNPSSTPKRKLLQTLHIPFNPESANLLHEITTLIHKHLEPK